MAKPLTDEQWIKQNSNLGPTRARLLGKCGKCGGKGKLWWVFGGERGVVQCDRCRGTGEAAK
ncbi:hypothetical protein ACFXB3_07315 [Streptomyces sp. NPDC059447]|uniref:hypothetical protein n=1 Tax=Streptomyces sp. NPDC059447 TaxID=3346834 RepID=UPI0036CE1562